MNVGIWRTSYSCPVSLVKEFSFYLISKWFAMTGFSVLCRELVLCSTSSGNGVEIVCGRDAS